MVRDLKWIFKLLGTILFPDILVNHQVGCLLFNFCCFDSDTGTNYCFPVLRGSCILDYLAEPFHFQQHVFVIFSL